MVWLKIWSNTNAAANFAGNIFFNSVLSFRTPITVTKGGINRAVEKYGIASVIHRQTISNKSDRHLLAAGSLGVINGIAKETVKTDNEINSPCARTAGKISSDDFVCCSVAKRSVSTKINN